MSQEPFDQAAYDAETTKILEKARAEANNRADLRGQNAIRNIKYNTSRLSVLWVLEHNGYMTDVLDAHRGKPIKSFLDALDKTASTWAIGFALPGGKIGPLDIQKQKEEWNPDFTRAAPKIVKIWAEGRKAMDWPTFEEKLAEARQLKKEKLGQPSR